MDTNVTFNTHNNEKRAGFDIVSSPKFGLLNGLSIPAGICLFKNKKRHERMVPDFETSKCIPIPERVYSNLFNLACYNAKKKTTTKTKTKSKRLRGSKSTNKNKIKL